MNYVNQICISWQYPLIWLCCVKIRKGWVKTLKEWEKLGKQNIPYRELVVADL